MSANFGVGVGILEKARVAELVGLVLGGDKKAFEALYLETNQNAYFVALRITKNEQDALDILQESYIKALEKLGQLSEPESFVPWFNKIVANTAKNYIGKSCPALFKDDEDERIATERQTEEDGDFIPEESLDTNETRAAVSEIIDGLPVDKRLCVLMFYFDEMGTREIAETLELSEGTVKSHLYYSRKTIREKIESLRGTGVTVLGTSAVPFFAWLLKKGTITVKLSESSAAAVLSTVEGASVLLGGAAVAGTAALAGATSGGAASAGVATAGTVAKIIAGITVPKIIAAITGAAVLIGGTTVGTKLVKQNTAKETTLLTGDVAVEAMATTEADTFGYGTDIYEETEGLGDNLTDTEASDKAVGSAYGDTTGAGGTTTKSSNGTTKAPVNITTTPASTTKAASASTTAAAATTTKSSTTATTKPLTTTTTAASTTTTKPATTTTTTKPMTTSTKPATTTTTTTTTTAPAVDYTYTVSGDNVTITGYTGSDGTVTVPDKIGGKNVTSIASYAFEDKTAVTKVTIPSGVETIGTGAFSGCTSLEEVTLPSGLSSLGGVAFKNCTKLSSITIPSGISSIGGGTFQGCSELENAHIPASVMSIGTNAFASCPSLTIYCEDGSAAHTYAVANGINIVLV